ncbi:5-formyltetrahydrofolate cyclo-ligase [Neorickettsia helminthoeca str. Oregon]|uniref:5-formyltetrahydrofolate cyclo-ligase n=1 Tax=Neorickettsia helminthoeca str. Oregon TaxID=1286528 RepID=X5GVL8_9RICK|nr:5-formyltetrahydrofolate cyclo-ligase [Neorickettsia helminthoeca]AHX11092.1 5-formyltetrahydrofolate cyclo-ligase [Neorickettsia helminthoeca str. Oregon]
MNKAPLRKKYRQIRKELPNKPLLDTSIMENFLREFRLRQYASIGLYIPLDGEVDPMLLLNNLTDKILCLPCTSGSREMLFRTWKNGDELIQLKNSQIRQPKNGVRITPDVVLVPLIAFNEDCHRLGFGKGFFDRFIDSSRSNGFHTRYIGLGYDEQLCAELKIEKHDQPLDSIITQSTVYRRK